MKRKIINIKSPSKNTKMGSHTKKKRMNYINFHSTCVYLVFVCILRALPPSINHAESERQRGWRKDHSAFPRGSKGGERSYTGKKHYIQSKRVAIYMCQTPTGPERRGGDPSTCLGVKGPWDQHSGGMNEVLCLTPRHSS